MEDLEPEEQERVKKMLTRLMELGIGAVYNDEGDDVPYSPVDCQDREEALILILIIIQFREGVGLVINFHKVGNIKVSILLCGGQ